MRVSPPLTCTFMVGEAGFEPTSSASRKLVGWTRTDGAGRKSQVRPDVGERADTTGRRHARQKRAMQVNRTAHLNDSYKSSSTRWMWAPRRGPGLRIEPGVRENLGTTPVTGMVAPLAAVRRCTMPRAV